MKTTIFQKKKKSKLDWTRGTKEQSKNEKPEPKLIYIWDKLATVYIQIQDILKLSSFLIATIHKNRCDCVIFLWTEIVQP